MLTFRAGAASGGGAKKMADHLMNMTLPTFEQDMAAYYQRGMTNVWKPGTEVAESNAAATAADAAQPGTIPEPRRDMAPSVAAALGITLTRPLTRDEIAELLAGNRADGKKIAGKQYRRAVMPLAEALTLDPMRLPTPGELANLVAGKRADGSALPPVAGMETQEVTTSRQDPETSNAEKGRSANAPRSNGNEALRHDGVPAQNETSAEQPRAIKVAEALAAAGVAYRTSGGRLRLKAAWRGGDGWTVSVNATTGQWRDFAAGESGRFESLIRRLGVKAEAAELDPEAAKAAREHDAKREVQRKSIAGKLWGDAVPGAGELMEPSLHGSAARRIRQRAEHAERVAEAEALRATARTYLTSRGLDAEWLMGQVRLMRPHANYDASEIKAGATAVLFTPMFGKSEAGGVQLTGLQRTYLTASGEKIERRMLGQAGAWLLQPPAGEAVPLGNHERVRLIGEGFETTASAVQATRQEGVVGYNAGGLVAWAEQFEGKEPIVILADRDNPRTFQGRDVGETGQKAAAKAASLIEARAGTALYLELPARVTGGSKGADWADALREGGPEGVRQAFVEAVASSAADRARIEAKVAALDAKGRDAHASRPLGSEQGSEAAAQEEMPPTHPALVRLYKAIGAEDGRQLTEVERENILAGKRANGKDLDLMAWRNVVTHAQTPIGYFDFTFSADKSVSLAWAFAPTEAERNQIVLAHKDAVAATTAEIEKVIGQARKGRAGLGGTEPGHIGWITFDHYTARPTLEIAHRGPDGKMETEIVSVKVAGDPQLHTHVAVPNVIVTDTGRVVSLNTLPMHGRIHEWGALYQAHLAQNLRKMGASVALDQETGAARLTAVPDEVRAAFSKRTRDALADAKAYAASVGADWEHLSPDERIKLLKGGACASRAAKSDDLSDFASWRSQLEAKGYLHESVLGKEVEKASTEEARFDRAYEAAARVLAKQFEGRAVLKESDERVAAARGLVAAGIKDGQDVDQVVARLHERGIPETGDDRSLARRTTIIAVEAASGDQESPAREEIAATRLTTRAHLAQESALVELAKKAGQDRSDALTSREIERGIAASGLTFKGEHGAAQQRLLTHLGASGRFAVGIGAAGAGKTTLLQPLVAAWHAQGADIHGISLGWRQARELRSAGLDAGDAIDARGRGAWAPRPNGNGRNGSGEAQPGGKSTGGLGEERDTVAAVSVFISRAKSGRIALSSKSVVVLDELGTVGTRQMLELLRLQEKHGFRMVAIGDPKQCQSIEAGQVIGLLEKALGKLPAIETTVRQTNARAKEIASLLRQGDAKTVAQALEMKRADHTAEIVPGGYHEAVDRAAALWDERRKANARRERYSLSVSTPTNEDARAIGEAIRKRLQASGELGRDQITVRAIDKNTGERYALPIAAGDKVRLFARTNAAMAGGSKGSIGDNGSILAVTAVRQGGLVLRNDRGREGFVKWETLADKAGGRMRLAYGYAMTTNTAQGITSTEHIFVTPRGSQTTDGFRSYVSGSRHRERSYWLTSEGAEKQEIGGRRPLGDPRPIQEPDIWANWARNVARQPEKTNALDLVELSEAARREAARDFLKGLVADERRQAERHPSALPHRFAEMRAYARQGERVAESMTFSAWYQGRMLAHMERAVPTVQRAIAAGWERARPLIEEARQAAQARVQRILGARQAPETSQASSTEPPDGLNAYWRGRIEQGKAIRRAREAALPENEREGRAHGRAL